MSRAGDYAIVALGSNLGDSLRLIRDAVDSLRAFSEGSFLEAPIYRSTPVDCPPGSPDFLNTVVAFVPLPKETPRSLLDKLQSLERAAGRKAKRVLNEARPLDLDIIAFNEIRVTEPDLMVPHPRAFERRFVLQPLVDILPNLVLPGLDETNAQLVTRLPGPSLERV